MRKGKGICDSCEGYFWKSQLSILPNDWRGELNKEYCPICYPDILKEYTEYYFENELENNVLIRKG